MPASFVQMAASTEYKFKELEYKFKFHVEDLITDLVNTGIVSFPTLQHTQWDNASWKLERLKINQPQKHGAYLKYIRRTKCEEHTSISSYEVSGTRMNFSPFRGSSSSIYFDVSCHSPCTALAQRKFHNTMKSRQKWSVKRGLRFKNLCKHLSNQQTN